MSDTMTRLKSGVGDYSDQVEATRRIEKLERQVKSLERIIVKARREFRMGGDPIEARAWLFRIDIDESKVNDE